MLLLRVLCKYQGSFGLLHGLISITPTLYLYICIHPWFVIVIFPFYCSYQYYFHIPPFIEVGQVEISDDSLSTEQTGINTSEVNAADIENNNDVLSTSEVTAEINLNPFLQAFKRTIDHLILIPLENNYIVYRGREKQRIGFHPKTINDGAVFFLWFTLLSSSSAVKADSNSNVEIPTIVMPDTHKIVR